MYCTYIPHQVRPFPRWGCPCSRDTRLFHSTSWRIGLTPWLIFQLVPGSAGTYICRVDPKRKFCNLKSYRGLGKGRGTAACAGGALAESFNTNPDCVARVFRRSLWSYPHRAFCSRWDPPCSIPLRLALGMPLVRRQSDTDASLRLSKTVLD